MTNADYSPPAGTSVPSEEQPFPAGASHEQWSHHDRQMGLHPSLSTKTTATPHKADGYTSPSLQVPKISPGIAHPEVWCVCQYDTSGGRSLLPPPRRGAHHQKHTEGFTVHDSDIS